VIVPWRVLVCCDRAMACVCVSLGLRPGLWVCNQKTARISMVFPTPLGHLQSPFLEILHTRVFFCRRSAFLSG
jgi:hypothetical protein